jgi:hypothetical protein
MITYQYTLICDRCGKKIITHAFIAYVGSVMANVGLPEGWNQVNSDIYCDDHDIEIVDIKKEVVD